MDMEPDGDSPGGDNVFKFGQHIGCRHVEVAHRCPSLSTWGLDQKTPSGAIRG